MPFPHDRIAALGLSVLLGAVPAAAQVAGQHPDPRFLVRAARESEVRFSGPPSSAPTFMDAAVVARIGSEDGDAANVFGDMVAAAIVDDSTIAIIDGTASEVRLFSRTGRHLQTFGRAGAGPGEFRGAAALVRAPDGALIVADARRMLQYFYPTGRGFEYRRSLPLPVAVLSMCFLGNTLFINGSSFDDAKIIRVLDQDGAVVRAFGEVYRSGNALINYQVGQGRLACDPERQLVYHLTGSLLGEVRAFRPTGEEVWRVRVSDFRTNQVQEQSGGGVQVVQSPTGSHAAGSILRFPGRGILAQWTLRTRAQMAAKDLPTEVHSVMIDPESGRPTYVGTGIPLLKDASANHVLAFSAELVPQLEVRRARGSRGVP